MKRSIRDFISKIFDVPNKRGYSANSLSLLLLALRPCLSRIGSKNRRGIIFPSLARSKDHKTITSQSEIKLKNHQTIIFSLATISIILPGIIISTTSASASAASLTLTIPEQLTLDLSPTATGQFQSSTPGTLKVQSDATFGYTFTIAKKNDDHENNLVNGSYTLASIAEQLTEDAYKNGDYKNTWAYKPSMFANAANDKYLPGPNTQPATIAKTTAASSDANEYYINIASKVDSSIPAGSYKGNFNFTATANSVPYSIKYELNEGQDGPTPNPQVGNSVEEKIKLSETQPTKDGYEFLGWCNQSTNSDSCQGDTLNPGDEIELTNGDNQFTFYAIWKSHGNEPKECAALTQVGQTGSFTDTRDNSTYSIARLADDKCWMTQNLRLVNKTISSENSDMKEGSFTIPANDLTKFTSNYSQDVLAAYYDGNTSHGAYYNWYTATAGTGTQDTPNGDAVSSICPKGWHLPTRDEYQTLNSAYPSGGLITGIPKFTAFGYVYNKAVQTGGTYLYSYYWSSSLFRDSGMDGVGNFASPSYIYSYTSGSSQSSGVSDGIAYYNYGYSVRCVGGELDLKPYSIRYDYSGVDPSYKGPDPNPQVGYADTGVQIDLREPYQGGKSWYGWCSEPTSDETCSGTVYKVESGGIRELHKDYIDFSEMGRDVTLYAMWKHYPNLSTFNCSSLSVGERSETFNYNDEKLVSARKLKDGKCWINSFGRYNWNNAQTACPSGWHLPSTTEFSNMARYYPGLSSSSDHYTSIYMDAGFNGEYWTSNSSGDNGYYVDVEYYYTGYNTNGSYRTLTQSKTRTEDASCIKN